MRLGDNREIIEIPLNTEELHRLLFTMWVPWWNYEARLPATAYQIWQRLHDHICALRDASGPQVLALSKQDLRALIHFAEEGLRELTGAADYHTLVGHPPEDGRELIERLYVALKPGAVGTNPRLIMALREIVNTFDPAGLIALGRPDDEYDDLTLPIAKELQRRPTLAELADFANNLFGRRYGDSKPATFLAISREALKFLSPEVVQKEWDIVSQIFLARRSINYSWREYNLSWGKQPPGLYAGLRFLAEKVMRLSKVRRNRDEYLVQLKDILRDIEARFAAGSDDIREAISRAFIEHLRDSFSLMESDVGYDAVAHNLGPETKKIWEELEKR